MKKSRLCRLAGYLLGDASIKKKYKRSGRFQIELSIEAADLSMVKDFRELCKELVNRKVGRIHSRKRSENWRKTYQFSCKINKKISKFLFDLSTFNKRDFSVKIPEIVFRNKKNKINFLQALFNSEGSVALNVSKNRKWWVITRYVKFSSKNLTILKTVKKILLSLEISCRISSLKNPKEITIQGKENLIKFSRLINFMYGIEISPFSIWGGYEKNKILKLAIISYKLKRGFLQQFRNKEEIYNFLQNSWPLSGDAF